MKKNNITKEEEERLTDKTNVVIVDRIDKEDETTDITNALMILDAGALQALDELAKPKPDENGEIHVSWVNGAINQKLLEMEGAGWDAIKLPVGDWIGSAGYDGTSVIIASDGKALISNNYFNSYSEVTTEIAKSIITIENQFVLLSDSKIFIYDKALATHTTIDYTDKLVEGEIIVGVTKCDATILVSTNHGNIFRSGLDFLETVVISAALMTLGGRITSDNKLTVVMIADTAFVVSRDAGLTWAYVFEDDTRVYIDVTYNKSNNVFGLIALDELVTFAPKNLDSPKSKDRLDVSSVEGDWTSISSSYDVMVALTGHNIYEGSNYCVVSYGANKWRTVAILTNKYVNVAYCVKYFLALSSDGDYQLSRSTNGGALSYQFATLEEALAGVEVQKAINPVALIAVKDIAIEEAKKFTISAVETLKIYTDEKFAEVDVEIDEINLKLDEKIDLIEKGAASGVTPLNEQIKVETTYLPVATDENKGISQIAKVQDILDGTNNELYVTPLTLQSYHTGTKEYLTTVEFTEDGFPYYFTDIMYNGKKLQYYNYTFTLKSRAHIYFHKKLLVKSINISVTPDYLRAENVSAPWDITMLTAESVAIDTTPRDFSFVSISGIVDDDLFPSRPAAPLVSCVGEVQTITFPVLPNRTYTIYAKPNGEDFSTLKSGLTEGTFSFTDGLHRRIRYGYALEAINEFGKSGMSDVASVEVLADPTPMTFAQTPNTTTITATVNFPLYKISTMIEGQQYRQWDFGVNVFPTLAAEAGANNPVYFVVRYFGENTETLFSPAQTFTAIPNCVAPNKPTATVVGKAITYTWNAVPYATSYYMGLYDQHGGSIVETLTTPTYTWISQVPTYKYQIDVQAKNSMSTSPWSPRSDWYQEDSPDIVQEWKTAGQYSFTPPAGYANASILLVGSGGYASTLPHSTIAGYNVRALSSDIDGDGGDVNPVQYRLPTGQSGYIGETSEMGQGGLEGGIGGSASGGVGGKGGDGLMSGAGNGGNGGSGRSSRWGAVYFTGGAGGNAGYAEQSQGYPGVGGAGSGEVPISSYYGGGVIAGNNGEGGGGHAYNGVNGNGGGGVYYQDFAPWTLGGEARFLYVCGAAAGNSNGGYVRIVWRK